MFLFPDLSQTPFLGFHAEIFVEFTEFVPEVAAELKEAFRVSPLELKGTDRDSFSKPYFISVNIQGGDHSAMWKSAFNGTGGGSWCPSRRRERQKNSRAARSPSLMHVTLRPRFENDSLCLMG